MIMETWMWLTAGLALLLALLWRCTTQWKDPISYTGYLRKTYPPLPAGVPKFAVIGAGFCGLGVCGALKRHHIPFDCYEEDTDVGGNWFHGVHPTVHIISSKKTTEFKDLPMPADYPDFPSGQQMCAYLRNYAQHFKIREHISFKAKVVSVKPSSDDQWTLEFADGSRKTYGGVIVATGHHWDCRWGGPYEGTFTGTTMHSKEYKHCSQLEGKRVLTIGGGNSACDVAVDAARVGASSHVSHRRGYWFLPRTAMGVPLVEMVKPWMPLWLQRIMLRAMLKVVIGRYEDFGLQKPDHRIFERHPTINSEVLEFIRKGKIVPHPDIRRFDGQRVEFVDGTSAEFDVVAHCTGFHVSVPLLSEEVVAWTRPKPVPGDGEKSRGYPDLIQGAVPRRHKNLFVFGLGQPRYGAGALITAGADSLAWLIRTQPKLKYPIGHVLYKAGVGKPLANYLMDPHAVFNKSVTTGRRVWMLPYLERWLVRSGPQ